MTSLNDLLQATPKLEIQLKLAAIHTVVSYFFINHVLVPMAVTMISNLKSKKRFIHFNRVLFKRRFDGISAIMRKNKSLL